MGPGKQLPRLPSWPNPAFQALQRRQEFEGSDPLLILGGSEKRSGLEATLGPPEGESQTQSLRAERPGATPPPP